MRKVQIYRYLAVFLIFLIEAAGVRVFQGETGFFPQLVLVLILASAIRQPFAEALGLSFFGGVLLETFSGLAFGADIFAVLVATLAVFLVTRKVTTQETRGLNAVLLVLLATAFFWLSAYLYNLLFFSLGRGPEIEFARLFESKIFWTGLWNAICFFPIRFLFALIGKDSPG